jgi:hypothetical protein
VPVFSRADEALRRHSNLKVIFMTGYTRNAVVHNGMLDSGVHFERLAAKARYQPRPGSV